MLYFIAIVAPVPINAEVLVWKKYMEREYGCVAALRSPAHITLVPPFTMKKEREEELGLYLASFSVTEKSFNINLFNFDTFAPRVIFVNVKPEEALLTLKNRLDDYLLPLKNFSFKKEERPFHPHITIANRDLKKTDFHKAREYFIELEYQASFSASAISLLRHNNKEWEIAGSYPLA
jgi:2'-5' RNA ligase